MEPCNWAYMCQIPLAWGEMPNPSPFPLEGDDQMNHLLRMTGMSHEVTKLDTIPHLLWCGLLPTGRLPLSCACSPSRRHARVKKKLLNVEITSDRTRKDIKYGNYSWSGQGNPQICQDIRRRV